MHADKDFDHDLGYRKLRVAAANFKPWAWHKEFNAARMEVFIRAAAKRKVDLVVLPECCLDGYLTMPALHYPKLRDELVATAEPIDGPYVKHFAKLAKQLNTCIVFGMAQRVGKRDVYNTAVFLDHRGKLSGTYSKMQFAEGYQDSHNWNRLGKTARAFDTPLGRCGTLICNDRWNPLLARTQCLDGARFLCVPTFGSKARAQDAAVLARARENGVPIVQSNVGLNLIISKGEIVAKDRALNRITIADIHVPDPITPASARHTERAFLADRPQRMAARWKATCKEGKGRTVPRPAKPRAAQPTIRDHT